MTMPNFFIIGAAKAGTTSLAYYLNQHPQIHISPIKEPNFFAFENENVKFQGIGDDEVINRHSINNLRDYQAHFSPDKNVVAVGDASTIYLYSQKAALNIKGYVPQAKLIVLLRHPVDRAYSNFLHAVRDNREPIINFSQALHLESIRMSNNWGPLWQYKFRSFYYTHLKFYFSHFSPCQLRVYLYKDFVQNPLGILKDIFFWFNIDQEYSPDTSFRLNVSGVPRFRLVNRLLSNYGNWQRFIVPFISPVVRKKLSSKLKALNLKKPKLSQDIRTQLLDEYREDTLNVQQLTQMDLSYWLT